MVCCCSRDLYSLMNSLNLDYVQEFHLFRGDNLLARLT